MTRRGNWKGLTSTMENIFATSTLTSSRGYTHMVCRNQQLIIFIIHHQYPDILPLESRVHTWEGQHYTNAPICIKYKSTITIICVNASSELSYWYWYNWPSFEQVLILLPATRGLGWALVTLILLSKPPLHWWSTLGMLSISVVSVFYRFQRVVPNWRK